METTDVAMHLRAADAPVLLDCLGTWLTARVDLHRAWEGAGLDAVHADIEELVTAWRECAVPAVAVSNEVGSGVVPASASGRYSRSSVLVRAASRCPAPVANDQPASTTPCAAGWMRILAGVSAPCTQPAACTAASARSSRRCIQA
ncbi:hypothetical protein C1Y40_04685 [Mycobacterium talmoniae]|uniref:Adenosylcobinamide kinase n=1 Tax=Mycobacterium talmoniae TaxID=1858794 RepID=A0A2S8BEW2_9MYCO|nr:hypothetical protein C1Y40_04685 [Mycobacterium talmoniae]